MAAGKFVLRAGALAACLVVFGPSLRADSLYGIHWWGWNGNTFDPAPAELLDTEHARGWTLETIITHSAPWWEAWFFSDLYTGLGQHNARAITRIDYNWGETVPAPATLGAADWASHVVGHVVNSLRHGGNIWQIGNEPNLIGEGNNWPDNRITPADYAAIYRAVRGATHAGAQPSPLGPHQVLVAPPSPGGAIPGIRWMDGNQWLAETLAAIPNDEIDGVAIHAYGDRNLPVETALLEFRRTFAEQMAVIRAQGLAHVPVYMTEFGQASASAADEARAAAFLRGAYDLLHQWNRVPGNQNIVTATWFVYDHDNQAGGGWSEWSIEYWRDHGNPPGSSDNLFTAFQEAVALRFPAGAEGSTALPDGVQIFDDFETGNGRFGSPLTWSPYSTGFLSATVQRVAEASYTKSYSQKLSIVDDPNNATPWRLRHLSGVANPNNNVPLPVTNGRDGFVGLFLKTTTPGMSARLVLDTTNPSTTSGLRAGRSHEIVADGEWHLYQWNLDAADWGPFPGVSGSVGSLPEGTAWINSLLIQGVNADAVIYFDGVMYRPGGNLFPMAGVSTSYGQWAGRYENLHALAAGSLAAKAGDEDGDGVANLVEYAFESRGADPLFPDRSFLPQPVLADGALTLDYPRDLAKEDIEVRAVVSSGLASWAGPEGATAPAGFADFKLGKEGAVEIRRASVPISAPDRLFLRLEVAPAP